MVRLLYVSAATEKCGDAEIEEILATARRLNAIIALSGMLLFVDRNFLQVIEGPAEAIESTFARIKADRRHKGIRVLERVQTSERYFPDWTMGFGRMKRWTGVHLPGMFVTTGTDLEERLPADLPDTVLTFMRNFHKVNVG